MLNAFLAVFLLLACACAAFMAVRRLRRGGGCCGEHESVPGRLVRNRRGSRYPYHVTLSLGGMTCENCARRIALALNRLDGVWARVSFSSRTASVRTRMVPDETALRAAVAEAGYVVMAYRTDS